MDSANRAQDGTEGPRPSAAGGVAVERSVGEGVSLTGLEPLTTLLVQTANSLYRIVVLRGTRVLVKGGRSFPEITAGDLFSLGANVLRLGWIGVGQRMEIHSGGRCVVTSPVRSVTIERRPSAGRPQ